MKRARAAIFMSLVGVLVASVMQLPAAGQEIYRAEGDIRTSNPVAGSTEQELSATCDHPPASQGVDAWVFELPESFGSTQVSVSLEGSRAAGGMYDLDAYFYASDCDLIDDFSMATKSADEAGSIPAETRFVVANLVFGTNTHVTLCVGITPCPDISSSPTPSVSPSDSTSASPTGSPSPTEVEGPNAEVNTTILSDRDETGFLRPFTLSGRLSSEHPDCGAYEEIGLRIRQRVFGGTDFEHVADAVVSQDGSWSVGVRAAHNASYVAEPQSNDNCSGSTSSPIDVLVRVDVVIDKGRKCTTEGVKGRVIPAHAESRVLLQRKARRWVTLDTDTLDSQSRFTLSPSKCRGPQRVLWPTQDVRNTEGVALFRFNRHRGGRR